MKQLFKSTKYILVMVMVGLMLGSGLPMATASKNAPVRMVPQNFSALAETVSPAVVHIRVEKTVKGGGPAFHQFEQNPFGDNEQFKNSSAVNSDSSVGPSSNNPGRAQGSSLTKPATLSPTTTWWQVPTQSRSSSKMIPNTMHK